MNNLGWRENPPQQPQKYDRSPRKSKPISVRVLLRTVHRAASCWEWQTPSSVRG